MDRQQKTPYNNPNEIEDLDEEDVIPPVHLDKSFSRYIIVDNLPIIPHEKEAKLLAVVKKIFGSAGSIKDVVMPYEDKEDKSKGFAFIEYSKAEEADLAVKQTNDVKLDAKHTLKVNHFEDVDKLQTLGDKYTAPETQEYQPAENLREWLLNPDGIDQFVIRYMNETEIFWNSFIGNKPKLEFKRTDWTESYLSWSQQGTYLATLHRLGVILWGGPKWTKYQKFHHPGVKLIDFSPCEKYIVTYSQLAEQESKDQAIIIWDVITGQKMRAFANLNPAWPAFKWSHDDKYFARVNEEGALSVYETNTFSLLNKKSYKLDAAIHDFAWSPSDDIISAWVPEYNNVPARVFLLQVPQLTVLSQKNLYNVIDCKMHWQGAGDYLCVKVDRHAGKNKAKIAVTNFELFRMREKGLPIEVLELKDEIVIAFAWEPKDKRFALIHCPEDSPRTNVSFYTMAGKQHKHLKTLEKRSANHLFWSPAGKYILIAGLRNFNGVLEFFNVQDLETITTEDHFNCTNIEWDPTGRYVATYVSFWRHPLENGYNLWTFSGKHLHREYREKFYQLLWRPRPPSLLSKEVEENIKKNFKQISEKYRKEDEERAEAARRAELERKAKLRRDYEDLLRQRWAEYKADAPKRRAITGHDDSDEENEYLLVEEDVEEVIDEQVIEEF